MVVSKTKKSVRQRGGTTHGWGSMKKHRGAGHRGGRGRAGSGKRGDAKKPSYQKARQRGKFGFKKKNKGTKIKPINIYMLEKGLPKYVKKNLVQEKDGIYTIDLAKLGFNKLLSMGTLHKKLNITALLASKKAVEKVAKAGGKVTLLSSPKAKDSKEAKEEPAKKPEQKEEKPVAPEKV